MNFKQRYIVAGVVILILILLSLINIPTIVLSEQNGDSKLMIPLWKSSEFTVEYLHSVNKTPVQEHFVSAPENKILLIGTEFRSLGVGTPFLSEEGQLVNDQGVYNLTGMNRSFDILHFVFLSLTEHTLLSQGKNFAFVDYFASGQIVELKIENYSIIKLVSHSLYAEGR